MKSLILFAILVQMGLYKCEELFKSLERNNEFISFTNFMKDDGYFLDVKILKEITARDYIDCWLECQSHPSCLSINADSEPDQKSRFWCKLLSDDKYNASDKFRPNGSSHHFRIPNPCENLRNCSGLVKCKADYVNNTGACACPACFIGDACESYISGALGMENGKILESQISASSALAEDHSPKFARLHNTFNPSAGNYGSWGAKTNQIGEYLQINLLVLKYITKVATQGIQR
ncbi:lactadherin isoform X2 [Nematostella vectensis]|uniref:lactadherin isoform X2 n=1 Tax=Nematostella vectensis TaxID=45351 RepID=UPI00138FB0BB|nr:lactadherin isoform X2 [Nematostella vectensis]